MSITSAAEAAALTEANLSLETVLADIEFAAGHGRHCWLFGRLPQEIMAELKERGFKCEGGAAPNHVMVSW